MLVTVLLKKNFGLGPGPNPGQKNILLLVSSRPRSKKNFDPGPVSAPVKRKFGPGPGTKIFLPRPGPRPLSSSLFEFFLR